MPWVRIHDGALRNFKIAHLSDRAFRLWVAGLAHCQEHLTDGLILREDLTMLSAKQTPAAIAELTTPSRGRAPLWHEQPDGHQIHDYLTWNEPADVVLKKRADKKARIDKWRSKTNSRDASQDALRDVLQDASCNAATTTTPLQTSGPPYPPQRGGRRMTRVERQTAERIRKAHGGCQHDPSCSTYEQCLQAITDERREAAAAVGA